MRLLWENGHVGPEKSVIMVDKLSVNRAATLA